MELISNKTWYYFWMGMAFISGAYLLFAIIPPTVLFAVYIEVMCFLGSLIFMWMAKRRWHKEGVN